MLTVASQDQDQIDHVQSLSSHSEKEKDAVIADIASVSGDSERLEKHMQSMNTDDPFPVDPNSPVEDQQLTVRAVLVGCILGAIIAASNIYLGLKVSCPSDMRYMHSSFHADGVDVWSIVVRLNHRLRDLETTLKKCTDFSWWRLFWA
jgi:hypothetical protein